MDGIVRNVYEIFEIIMAVTILLLIGSSILYVANSNNLQASATASEVSYISTLISKSDMIAELDYDETNIKSGDEYVEINYKNSKISVNKNYIGGEVRIIEIEKDEKYRICSGETCDFISPKTTTSP